MGHRQGSWHQSLTGPNTLNDSPSQERPSFCFYKVDLPATGLPQRSPALHIPVYTQGAGQPWRQNWRTE